MTSLISYKYLYNPEKPLQMTGAIVEFCLFVCFLGLGCWDGGEGHDALAH